MCCVSHNSSHFLPLLDKRSNHEKRKIIFYRKKCVFVPMLKHPNINTRRGMRVTCIRWGWWLIWEISKEGSLHEKRCDSCKAASSPFEVPVCIVEAHKGILSPLFLQENISQAGLITLGGGGGDMGRLMHYRHVYAIPTLITFASSVFVEEATCV